MGSRLRRLIRAFVRALISVLAAFVPKCSGLWVVGGNRGLRYADNSMHFHRYCVANGLDAVWLTRSRKVLAELQGQGNRAYLIASLHGLWYGLRATWHVFDVGPSDTGPTAACAQRMNLWHGIPLKDTSFLKSNRRCRAPDPSDHFAHPNRRFLRHILASFPLLESNVVLADLPRNKVFSADYDPTTDAKASDLEWVDRLRSERARGKAIIGYFPTWRGNGNDLFLGARTAEEIRRLDDYLESSNLVLATKWHTCSFDEYKHQGASRTAGQIDSDLSNLANVLSLPFELDLNTILPECDVLATDYSSVLFDFALSDRPQIFVPYDLEQYESAVGFFHDYASLVPGRVVRDVTGLIAELEAFKQSPANYRALSAGKRALLRAEFFEVSASSPLIAAYMMAVEAAGGPHPLADRHG